MQRRKLFALNAPSIRGGFRPRQVEVFSRSTHRRRRTAARCDASPSAATRERVGAVAPRPVYGRDGGRRIATSRGHGESDRRDFRACSPWDWMRFRWSGQPGWASTQRRHALEIVDHRAGAGAATHRRRARHRIAQRAGRPRAPRCSACPWRNARPCADRALARGPSAFARRGLRPRRDEAGVRKGPAADRRHSSAVLSGHAICSIPRFALITEAVYQRSRQRERARFALPRQKCCEHRAGSVQLPPPETARRRCPRRAGRRGRPRSPGSAISAAMAAAAEAFEQPLALLGGRAWPGMPETPLAVMCWNGRQRYDAFARAQRTPSPRSVARDGEIGGVHEIALQRHHHRGFRLARRA